MLIDRIIAALFAGALAFFPPLAFAQSSPLPGFSPGVFQSRAALDASSGAVATWTPTDAQANDSCGFTTTCTTTDTVATGLNVTGFGGYPTTAQSAATTCSTSLTEAVTSGIFASAQEVSLWYGSISCSGAQSIIGTASGGWFFMNTTTGSLNNLISNTPTSTCSAGIVAVVGGALPCGSSITIPASGFAICNTWVTSGGTNPTISGFTADKTIVGTHSTSVILHNSSAGTITPSMSTSTGFSAGLACATWH